MTLDAKQCDSAARVAFMKEDIQCVTLWHVTVLSNFARAYDKYSRNYSKAAIPESTYPDRFYLLPEEEINTGVRKARQLLDRLAIPGNRLLAMRTVVPKHDLKKNERTGIGYYIESNGIRLDGVALVDNDAPSGNLAPVSIEEAVAMSIRLLRPQLLTYRDLRPRTFSILPIARGCQAACPFCFSAASASVEQEQGKLKLAKVRTFAEAARLRGAERFVITGGGEPGLVRPETLLNFIRVGQDTMGKSVLITNGHHLARLADSDRAKSFAEYGAAGLNVLAISRHHHQDAISLRLMSLDTDVAAIVNTWNRNRQHWPMLRLRLTCVLQQGGIDSMEQLQTYVTWAVALGIEELCFKELYVSTSVESLYHRHAANEWSKQHQVPLALVLDFGVQHGFVEESCLPWGSPVLQGTWHGAPLRIAAYTEPSLLWERTHGVARSWNLMADGRCLASLEDRESVVELEDAA